MSVAWEGKLRVTVAWEGAGGVRQAGRQDGTVERHGREAQGGNGDGGISSSTRIFLCVFLEEGTRRRRAVGGVFLFFPISISKKVWNNGLGAKGWW